MGVLVTATLIVWGACVWCVVSASRARGVVRTLKRVLAALGSAALGGLLGLLLVCVQALHAFSGETLVARVTTRPLSAEAFELTYTPVGATKSLQKRVQLRGDQWAISGGIVKWQPWMTALGLPSYHKPLRLSGQFSTLALQRAQAPTVEPLEPSGDLLWEALYRAAPYLPVVETVYGSSAYVYVEPAVVQDIYVTPSGYLIKRHPPSVHPF